jgi:peptidoglycan/LPS O-acetylase OafA/YrhL
MTCPRNHRLRSSGNDFSVMTVQQPHLSNPKYRPDIDGLRAVAVLAVVAFHAFPSWVRGGFIGVDVFFVISGYLISTIIFENLNKGTFSFSEFYVRRIKRIFPALLIVLIACFVLGWFALLANEYKQLGKHIAAGTSFISNFILWNESGYFDNLAETKPLLHLWSLGIEEQFYIVWPLLLWLAWKRKFNFLTITIVVAIASFIFNMQGVKQDMVATFYSPQTRFWELLSGSLLAWVALHNKEGILNIKHNCDVFLSRIVYNEKQPTNNKLSVNILSIIGFLLLIYGFLRINKELSFPGKWALVPVLGAVLIIAAGSKAWVNRTILSNKVAVWVGLISFPLYLWHWPLLSFARIVESDTPSRDLRIGIVLLSIILAWLTCKFVEQPLRFGVRYTFKKLASLVTIATAVCFCGLYIYFSEGLPFRHPAHEKNFKQFTWGQIDNFTHECLDKYGVKLGNYCLTTDIKKDPDIILLGDSNANHLFIGMKEAIPEKTIMNIGQGACIPFIGLSVKLAEGESNCQNIMETALALVDSKSSVKTVIISMMGAGYINAKRDINGGGLEIHSVNIHDRSDRISLFKNGMIKTIQRLQKSGKQVVFVISTPRLNFDPSRCGVRPLLINDRNTNLPCSMPYDTYMSDNKLYRDVVFEVLKNFPDVKVFDSSLYLCKEGNCNAIINDEVMYRDSVHLSYLGSMYLGRIFREKIFEQYLVGYQSN